MNDIKKLTIIHGFISGMGILLCGCLLSIAMLLDLIPFQLAIFMVVLCAIIITITTLLFIRKEYKQKD